MLEELKPLDAMTNPSNTGAVTAFLMQFNGSTWDRFTGSGGGGGGGAADGTTFTAGTTVFTPSGGVFNDAVAALSSGKEGAVRLTANRAFHVNLRTAAGVELLGQQTMAASIPVTLASNQSALAVSQSGTWTVATNADSTPGSAIPAKGFIVGGSDGTNYRNLSVTSAGVLNVAVAAGTALAGSVVDAASATVGTAYSFFSNLALSTTVTAVKGSAAKLMGFRIYSVNLADAFLQVFNKTTGSVTLGTTVPDEVYPVPAGASSTIGGFYDIVLTSVGVAYGTAISVAATTTATGSSALGTALVVHAYFI